MEAENGEGARSGNYQTDLEDYDGYADTTGSGPDYRGSSRHVEQTRRVYEHAEKEYAKAKENYAKAQTEWRHAKNALIKFKSAYADAIIEQAQRAFKKGLSRG